jgi:hypothetical protein
MKHFVIGLVAALGLTTASQTLAGPHGHHGHRHYHQRHWHNPAPHHWIVPALIGGAVVYAATRPDPVIVQQSAPAPIVVNPQYVIIDGITYKKEVMVVNGIAQEVLIRVQ